MSTTKCGHTVPCGCADVALTTPAPCTPVGCPDPYPCSETINAECVIYTGANILCGETVIVSEGMTAAEAYLAITNYFCSNTGSISSNILCGTDIVVPAGTPFANALQLVVAYYCTNQPDDSGWVNLEGFTYYQGAMASNIPQVRKMGKQIHFRGDLYLPLSDGTAIPLTTPDTYRALLFKTPYIGAGGLINDGTDRLLFNSSGSAAQSVIPTSVLPALTNLDGTYKLSKLIATRQLRIAEPKSPTGSGTLTLTAPITLEILPNKTLRITPVEVIESNSVDTISFDGNSAFRNITSSFMGRQKMTNLKNWVSSRSGLHTNGNIQTTGLLVIGRLYTMLDSFIGDDFTNVGAITTQYGQSFIATGTTPTSWTLGTELMVVDLADIEASYPSNGNNSVATLPILLDGSYFDAGSHTDIGGFKISLDGLIAYLT